MHIDEKVAEMESFRGDKEFLSMVDKLHQAFTSGERSKKSSSGGRSSACLSVYVPGTSNVACGGDCYYITSTIPIQTVNVTAYVAQPLLTTLWHQKPPYNNGQPDGGCTTAGYCGSNSKYLAGCVPIAEGQVVAYFYAKKYANWQSITGKVCWNYTQDETNAVANLAHSIFLEYNWPYNSRACGETSAGWNLGDIHFTNPRGISPTYGLVQGEWRDWNTGDIRNSLAASRPVVIEGWQNLCCFIWCWGCGDVAMGMSG
jgi:hypothetical protein